MSRKRVLFIEDEKEFSADLPAVLEAQGFEVVIITDVNNVLRIFNESNFDVVLTDIAMPPGSDMDAKAVAYGRETGIEVVRRMRELKPNIPIIALTVIRDLEIVSRIKKTGIRQILYKPVELQTIVNTLLAVTQKK